MNVPPHLTLPVTDQDHSLGLETAPLVLVEYGDFECPDCGNADPQVKQWQRQFGPKLRFVYRNMPLDQIYDIHPHATQAALASEAAARQGKFWEMHDLLFENQEHLEPSDLTSYAQRLDLDMDRFDADMSDPALAQLVSGQLESGKAAGVTSTPIFFLNGIRIDNSRDYESLAKKLEKAAE